MKQAHFLNLRRLFGLPALLACIGGAMMPAMAALPQPHFVGTTRTGFRRTNYPNGLVLLSKEVHAAPVVSVWTYFRVGSINETQGIFGISHQVEHMMFKGTHRLHPGDIDRLFSERGGENNAMTTQDYTAYNETLPSSALAVALGVEADRMEHSAMLAAELNHEKTVVLSEMEGDENSPLYKLDTAVTEAAFQAHPYHNPIGGYLYDIHRFTRPAVATYYATHYAPNNAVLIVVGDFNTLALQKAVAYYFAQDHPRPVAAHTITREPPQTGERRVNVVGIGDTRYVELAYHVPETGARDHYVMDVISTILSSGRSSRLYRGLVDKGLATEVEAGDPDQKDPFLMEITATVARGHTQREVEDAIEAELDHLKTEPVSADELQKTVNQVKASFVYRNDSVTSQASEQGLYAAIGSYRYLDTYLERIQTITPALIQRAAEQYFTQENRTAGWFIPRAPRPGEALPTAGRAGAIHYRTGGTEPSRKPWVNIHAVRPAVVLTRRVLGVGLGTLVTRPPAVKRTAHKGAAHKPAAHKPAARHPGPRPSSRVLAVPGLASLVPSATRSHPSAFRQVLPNGLVVIVYPNHANPDISISGSIKAGALADPLGKAGVANFTANMLSRGTTTRSELQIASQLDFVGASVDVNAAGSGTFFTAHSLKENFPLVLDILSDELRKPSFPQDTLERVRNEIQTAIQEGNNDPATTARQAMYAALYPPDYPLHWPAIGTLDTIPKISRQDLVDYHNSYYRPDLATIVIVGDVEPAVAVQQISTYFAAWTAEGPRPETEPAVVENQVPAARIINTMPDKTEAIVSIGSRGITRRDPGYYPAYLMNLILGNGDFNSILMKDIRDQKGLVYYVGSAWQAGIVAGPWMLQMETNPANVDRAISSAINDIRLVQRTGFPAPVIKLFKSWVTGNQSLQLETNAGIADMLMESEYYGLGLDYLWRYPHLINAVSPPQILDAARRYLHPDNLVTSIAGPYAAAGATSH